MHLDLSRGRNIFRTDRKKKEIRKLSEQFREINNCGPMKINVLAAESVEMDLKWQKVSIFFYFSYSTCKSLWGDVFFIDFDDVHDKPVFRYK